VRAKNNSHCVKELPFYLRTCISLFKDPVEFQNHSTNATNHRGTQLSFGLVTPVGVATIDMLPLQLFQKEENTKQVDLSYRQKKLL